MNKYLNEKLKIISFLSMILVVYLHSYNPVVKSLYGTIVLDKGFSLFVQNFISQGLTRIAVPIFFAISGYLFFLKIEGKLPDFILKFRKRLSTLVIPYLFWSMWGLLFYFVLQLFPQAKMFFINNLIRDYSFNELTTTLLLKPIPYQLWFVRDLILLIFISPIIFWYLRYLKWFGIGIVLVTWYVDFDYFAFTGESLLFFLVGSLLSLNKSQLPLLLLSSKHLTFTFLWILIILLKTLLIHNDFENEILLSMLQKTGILIGIVAVWGLYDYLVKNRNVEDFKFYSLCSFSFFLYAFHEPVLTMIKKGLFYLIGQGEMSSLLIYLIAPIVTIVISLTVGYYLKRFAPRFYGITTGGR